MKRINDLVYYKDKQLDLYIPDQDNFPTIVYFHGGGIVEGDKSWTTNLAEHIVKLGYGVASVNYSLYPNTKYPEFLKEAAFAVKFVHDHIKEYGGSNHLYISGQSAGAYITMMLCMNEQFLREVGLSPLEIKGFISDSGQMSDHFHVQQFEKGIDPWQQRITEYAPLYYVAPEIKTSSIFLIWYSDDMFCRKEQNILFAKALKYYFPDIDLEYQELPGGHCQGSGQVDETGEYPFVRLLDDWLKRHEKK